MDKIKSLFEKKRKNGKFVNAGKGCRLSDTTRPTASSQPREPIIRVEPTEEAKVAGQAALSRLQAAQNVAKRSRSYAAITAQVLRELEQEKEAQQVVQQNDAKSKQESEESVKKKSSLAIDNVYFRCPHLSNEVLSKEEWRAKIRTFLYEQLEGEEAGLTSCLVIKNCNPNREKVESCIEILEKYLENIINNPETEKYRQIRMQNRIFQAKVRPLEGVMEFLNAAGFRETKLPNNDIEENFLVWSPENCDIEYLNILLCALKTAEIIPLELDRNVQVLMPAQARERVEFPPNFFSLKLEEIKREQQLRTEAVERNQMLRTKAMREKDEKRNQLKYKYSLIRIKFPDNIILQGTFFVHDKLQDVYDFVSENIENSETPFQLQILHGKSFNKSDLSKTLLELEIFPNVLFIFIPEGGSSVHLTDSVGYLKEELLAFIQS